MIPLARNPSEVGREELLLKAENLQVTGAYKPRAAFTVLGSLTAEQRKRGVVLSSSGNFAQAFAYAGAVLGIPIVVVMMEQTSASKVEATRAYGAEVVFCGTEFFAREPTVLEIASKRGMTPIDIYETPEVMIGHGTIGLEILEQVPDVTTVLVPISSGGLSAGVAVAVKESDPSIRVIAVQPERANAAHLSWQRGEPTTIDHWDSLADALSARRPGTLPFEHLLRYLDDILLISEAELAAAFSTVLYRAKTLVEPAGAVAPAAYLSGKVRAPGKTVAILSGGNVDAEVVRRLLKA